MRPWNKNIVKLKEISSSDVEHELKSLNSKKANTFKNIPPKLLKENFDICNDTILRVINNGIRTSQFPNDLKLADVTPIFKKVDSSDQLVFYQLCRKFLKEFYKSK